MRPFMTPEELKCLRLRLGLTQDELAQKLRTTRMTVTRYEGGTRRIPGMVEVALQQLAAVPSLPLVGLVAAGQPLEPIPQTDLADVPPSMLRHGESFCLKVKGDSMKEDGILSGDMLVVRKQATARHGQTVV